MDIVWWGRMLWMRVQHHDKMVMIDDISSAVMITSRSKGLQNVGNLYHFNTVLYPNTPQGTQTAGVSLAGGQLSTNVNCMNPHTITYYNQSGLVLLSHTEDWQ
jgi:hypothetical protein